MRDIAIAKSEFRDGERAITKLQDFQWDDTLFGYCKHPAVSKVSAIICLFFLLRTLRGRSKNANMAVSSSCHGNWQTVGT